ncbi:MAG TPA: RND transporter, partial [Candidatus Woesebacteria bacterium]|nr:RND transporter [Candidatus Woesebacteria bacterium]
ADGESYVRVQKNGQVEQVSVETGISSDSYIEIISGLSEGDTVITSTISNTTSGTGGSAFSTGFGGGGGAVRMIR